MRPSTLRLVLPAVLACACGGGAGAGAQAAPRGGGSGAAGTGQAQDLSQVPARSEAVLVGPLCQGDVCRCREGDDDAGSPPAGFKRFEVRLGPSNDPLWATVDGMVLLKSDQAQEACFYVDLKAGEHAVTLRGRGDQGLSAAMAIAEQGGAQDATWWYRTFDFQCGTPGQCDLEQIERWKADVAKLAGKHDPCGSTKVQKMRWETGRMPDRNHPDDLALHLVLNIYKFTPTDPPGSPECDKRGDGSGQEGGAAE